MNRTSSVTASTTSFRLPILCRSKDLPASLRAIASDRAGAPDQKAARMLIADDFEHQGLRRCQDTHGRHGCPRGTKLMNTYWCACCRKPVDELVGIFSERDFVSAIACDGC